MRVHKISNFVTTCCKFSFHTPFQNHTMQEIHSHSSSIIFTILQDHNYIGLTSPPPSTPPFSRPKRTVPFRWKVGIQLPVVVLPATQGTHRDRTHPTWNLASFRLTFSFLLSNHFHLLPSTKVQMTIAMAMTDRSSPRHGLDSTRRLISISGWIWSSSVFTHNWN